MSTTTVAIARRGRRGRWKSYLTASAMFLVLLISVTPAPPVAAATFSVTNLNPSGSGSLRQALLDLDSTLDVSSQIVFDPDLDGTIVLGASLPDVNRRVSIVGPTAGSVTIDGQSTHSAFRVNGPLLTGTFSISDLTITRTFGGAGPALNVDEAPTSIERVSFVDNYGTGPGGAVWANDSLLSVSDSIFRENHSAVSGGGLVVRGNPATITGTTFESNDAINGGAISSTADVSLTSSTVVDNIATGRGGGLSIGSFSRLSIASSTIARNDAAGGGGMDLGSDVTASVENSVIANNTADLQGGGVVTLGSFSGDGVVFSENVAGMSGGALFAPESVSSGVVLRNGELTGNQAPIGAAISAPGWTIEEASVVGNTSASSILQSSGGVGTLRRVRVAENTGTPVVAAALTGREMSFSGNVGVTAGAIDATGPVTLWTSTFHDNTGGAATIVGRGLGSTSIELTEVTLVDQGVSQLAPSGALVLDHVALDGAIFSASSVAPSFDHVVSARPRPPDVNAASSVFDADLLLEPLANNGGVTDSMLPLGVSPLVDAGSEIQLAEGGDQRLALRLVGAAQDVGAVEVQVGEVPFVESVVPARLFDSRAGERTVDGRFAGAGRLGAGSTVIVPVASRGGVPAGARSAVLNVTAVGSSGSGFFTVFPCGDRPVASSLNFVPGPPVANELIAGLSGSGDVCVFSSVAVNLLVDVVGFVPERSPHRAVRPARVLDTRPGASTVDGLNSGVGKRSALQRTELVVAGRGGVPLSARSVIVNVTVAQTEGTGFVTVDPCTAEVPTASSLNHTGTGVIRANEVVAQLSEDGSICLFNQSATHVLVDVVGWLPELVDAESVGPARLVDTRAGEVTIDGLQAGGGAVSAGGTFVVEAAGRAGVPVDARGVVVNLTGIRPGALGFLTVWDCDGLPPLASSLNYGAGSVNANEIVVALGDDGQFCVFSAADTHLAVDVVAALA